VTCNSLEGYRCEERRFSRISRFVVAQTRSWCNNGSRHSVVSFIQEIPAEVSLFLHVIAGDRSGRPGNR
jgi:hypothetical protein